MHIYLSISANLVDKCDEVCIINTVATCFHCSRSW